MFKIEHSKDNMHTQIKLLQLIITYFMGSSDSDKKVTFRKIKIKLVYDSDAYSRLRKSGKGIFLNNDDEVLIYC